MQGATGEEEITTCCSCSGWWQVFYVFSFVFYYFNVKQHDTLDTSTKAMLPLRCGAVRCRCKSPRHASDHPREACLYRAAAPMQSSRHPSVALQCGAIPVNSTRLRPPHREPCPYTAAPLQSPRHPSMPLQCDTIAVTSTNLKPPPRAMPLQCGGAVTVR